MTPVLACDPPVLPLTPPVSHTMQCGRYRLRSSPHPRSSPCPRRPFVPVLATILLQSPSRPLFLSSLIPEYIVAPVTLAICSVATPSPCSPLRSAHSHSLMLALPPLPYPFDTTPYHCTTDDPTHPLLLLSLCPTHSLRVGWPPSPT